MTIRLGMGYLNATLLVGEHIVPRKTPVVFAVTQVGYSVKVIGGGFEGLCFVLDVPTADESIIELDNWNQYRG